MSGIEASEPFPFKKSSHSKLGKCQYSDFKLSDKPVAAGAMAAVYKATHIPSNTTVVIKFYTPENAKHMMPMLVREENIMSMISHENIVEYYCSTITPNNEIYMAMEWLEAKEILELALPFDKNLKPVWTPQTFSKARIAEITREVSSALHYLHEKGILHYDLHVMNVLITNKEGKVKLIDFGSSVVDFSDKTTSLSNHPAFWAPEVFLAGMTKEDGTLHTIGRSVDYFSIGVIAYALQKNNLPVMIDDGYVEQYLKKIDPPKWTD